MSQEMKALVVKFTGKISENTFPEYKMQAVDFVKRADFPIVGNEDFSNAVNDVKKCGEIESKITTVIDSVFSGAKEVNAIVEDLREVYATVRTFRLKREKDIAAETERKRKKMILDGFEKVSAIFSKESKETPLVNHVISISEAPFKEALKGKRTEATGEKAIEATVEMETQKIKNAVLLVAENNKLISESGYIELFPDLTAIIGKPTSEIKLLVDGRVATHQLSEKERKEKEEKEAKEAKEAQALKDAAAADKKPIEQTPTIPGIKVPVPQPTYATGKARQSTVSVEGNSEFVLKLLLSCTAIAAGEIANRIDEVCSSIPEITCITLETKSNNSAGQ